MWLKGRISLSPPEIKGKAELEAIFRKSLAVEREREREREREKEQGR
jgi:hypothetical protein